MTGYLVVDPAAGLGNIGIHRGRLRSTTDAPGNNSCLWSRMVMVVVVVVEVLVVVVVVVRYG